MTVMTSRDFCGCVNPAVAIGPDSRRGLPAGDAALLEKKSQIR